MQHIIHIMHKGVHWSWESRRPNSIWAECDENQQAFKDPLHVLIRPITRARSKKIKEALNGLIQEIWANSNTRHSKLGPKEDEGVINLIQAIEGWSVLIERDLWRGLMADWLSSPILVNSHFSYSETYYFWYFYAKNVILGLGDLFPCF